MHPDEPETPGKDDETPAPIEDAGKRVPDPVVADDNVVADMLDAVAPATPEKAAQDKPHDLEAKLAETNDRLLRALAEIDNTQRRAARDKTEALRFAITGFARDILGVADNLQRALAATQDESALPEGARALRDGVAAIERELQAALQRHKITPIDPKGEKFDPNLHEAMFETDETDAPAGIVIEVIEIGYMIDDRLLRPARVGVAKDKN